MELMNAALKEICPPLDAPMLLATLRRVCRESSVAYDPPGANENLVALKSARTFLSECRAAGVDPLQLVQALARSWKHFRGGVLTEAGRQIYLPTSINFLHFFRFRKKIIRWLNANT
jgi:hypothetical protein